MKFFKENKDHVHLNLARLKKSGEIFEIDVDPDLALKFKNGEDVELREVLKAETVFSDAQKGLAASSAKMKEVFGTDDIMAVAEAIIADGEIQMTGEHRAKLIEQKKRQIISIIHRNGIDPRTKAPHPAARIESAMDSAKIKIDGKKSAEEQVNGVLDALRAILPITFAKTEIWIKVDAQDSHKVQNAIRSTSKILKESWKNDGSWEVTVEIPGGLQEDFFNKLNYLTRGQVEVKILR